jgi:hypothetical protein
MKMKFKLAILSPPCFYFGKKETNFQKVGHLIEPGSLRHWEWSSVDPSSRQEAGVALPHCDVVHTLTSFKGVFLKTKIGNTHPLGGTLRGDILRAGVSFVS